MPQLTDEALTQGARELLQACPLTTTDQVTALDLAAAFQDGLPEQLTVRLVVESAAMVVLVAMEHGDISAEAMKAAGIEMTDGFMSGKGVLHLVMLRALELYSAGE